jgi:hypothetical protein
VNQETLQLGPKEAMQFGQAFEQIFYQVWHANPHFDHVYWQSWPGRWLLSSVVVSPLGAIPKLFVALPAY